MLMAIGISEGYFCLMVLLNHYPDMNPFLADVIGIYGPIVQCCCKQEVEFLYFQNSQVYKYSLYSSAQLNLFQEGQTFNACIVGRRF